MSENSYSTSFVVDQSPAEVFAAVNDVRGWWTGDVEGDTDRLGAEFTYRYEPLHRSRQRITELSPERIVWNVVDAELTFVADPAEWKGTDIIFEIIPEAGRTELRFTHAGLVSGFECYDDCSKAWGYYIGESLRKHIAATQP
jgi:hypothetical protein